MANLIAAMLKPKPPLLGWFGKLPRLGDFAGKALPLALRNQIHSWCAQGMEGLTQSQGEAWKAAYQLAPVWHFAMNAHIWDSRPLIGCLAPSMDRIGRYSPLLVLRSIEAPLIKEYQYLLSCSYWLQRVENLLRQVIRGELGMEAIQNELEVALRAQNSGQRKSNSTGDILAELDIARETDTNRFSWPDLPERFKEGKKHSFWWTEPSPGRPPQQVIHHGAPDENLFALLMVGWACGQPFSGKISP